MATDILVLNGGSTVVNCPDCDKEFAHPRNLQQHRRVQHEGLRYYCQDCDVSYTRQYNLTHHRLKAHPDKIPPEEAQALRKKYIYPIVAQNSKTRPTHSHQIGKNRRLSTGQLLRMGLTHRTKDNLLAPPTMVVNQDVPMFLAPSPPGSHTASSNSGSGISDSGGQQNVVSPGAVIQRKVDKFRCMLCPFSTNMIENLRAHATKHAKLNTEQTTPTYMCKFCDFGTDSENTLLQHCGTHFEWIRWNWDKNGADDSNDLIPSIAPSVRCTNCDRMFTDIQQLSQHEALHLLKY